MQRLNYCISYGRDGYTVTLLGDDLFSRKSIYLIPRS